MQKSGTKTVLKALLGLIELTRQIFMTIFEDLLNSITHTKLFEPSNIFGTVLNPAF